MTTSVHKANFSLKPENFSARDGQPQRRNKARLQMHLQTSTRA